MKPGVWETVMERDKVCVLSFLEPGHECRTAYGSPHRPMSILTYRAREADVGDERPQVRRSALGRGALRSRE